jgi:hypothetical protein
MARRHEQRMSRRHHRPMSDAPIRSRKKAIGCLSGLLLLFLVGPLAIVSIDLAFAPWIYVVGDRTRFLPVWAGIGVAQSPFGQYTSRIWFSPRPSGSRILPSASVLGSAYVCTPTGNGYALRVTGGAIGRIWRSMSGRTIHLFAEHGPILYSVDGECRPRLAFSGKWVGADLVMDDEGSIAKAFLADGNLRPDAIISHSLGAATRIIFHESTEVWFHRSCSD